MDYFEKHQKIRLKWKSSAVRISPVTGKKEEYDPYRYIQIRGLVSISTVTIVFLVLCSIIVGNIFAAHYIQLARKRDGGGVVGTYGGTALSAVFSIFLIFALIPAYSFFTLFLTEFENHRTKSDYLDALIWKDFTGNFVTTYGLLVYYGVIEPVVHAFNPSVFSDASQDKLVLSIAIVFGGTQFLAQMTQVILPWIILKYNIYRDSETHDDDGISQHAIEDDFSPNNPTKLMFEYSTKIVQLGYVLLFTAPFALSPILACINNFIEMRVDAYKFLALYRRPFCDGADDIGSWEKVIGLLIYCGIITNALIVAFASHGFQEWLPEDTSSHLYIRCCFVFLFQVF
jgi:hypothetical protein